MKKLMIVAVLVGLGMSSCKKEETAKPATKSEKGVMLGEKKDMGGWD